MRLDYLFAPTSSVPRVVRCEVLRPEQAAKASDHYPLLAELGDIPGGPAAS